MQGFPEAALRQATAGREVLEARDHFFTHGNVPHLALNNNNNNGFRISSTMRQDTQGPIRHRPCPADAGTNMQETGRRVAEAKVVPVLWPNMRGNETLADRLFSTAMDGCRERHQPPQAGVKKVQLE